VTNWRFSNSSLFFGILYPIESSLHPFVVFFEFSHYLPLMSILSVNNLSKRYGPIQALNNVSFDVPKGSVFGILGPNGSGKTTLLGIVMDVIKATSGNYNWMGQPSTEDQRKQIGTLLETPNFYHYLSGERNLLIAAAIKEKDPADIPRVLQIVNLLQRKDSKFNTYSLGMKQRLAIASTLLGNPDILVFDEPTNGLDPAGIAEIRELMKQLNREGKTIIMASHILDEVEKVCSHVAIIQKGVLKTIGTVNEVLSTTDDTSVSIDLAADDMKLLETILRQMPGVVSVHDANGTLHISCEESVTAAQVNRWCFEKGIVLNQLSMKRKTLEKRFLEITGTQSDR
jgi:ABC-type multidrug transport system ATPase subunit